MNKKTTALTLICIANFVIFMAFATFQEELIQKAVDDRFDRLNETSNNIYKKDMKANGLRSINDIMARIVYLEIVTGIIPAQPAPFTPPLKQLKNE